MISTKQNKWVSTFLGKKFNHLWYLSVEKMQKMRVGFRFYIQNGRDWYHGHRVNLAYLKACDVGGRFMVDLSSTQLESSF